MPCKAKVDRNGLAVADVEVAVRFGGEPSDDAIGRFLAVDIGQKAFLEHGVGIHRGCWFAGALFLLLLRCGVGAGFSRNSGLPRRLGGLGLLGSVWERHFGTFGYASYVGCYRRLHGGKNGLLC